jgi:hypothetical protein
MYQDLIGTKTSLVVAASVSLQGPGPSPDQLLLQKGDIYPTFSLK